MASIYWKACELNLSVLAGILLLCIFQMAGCARQVVYESASDSFSRGDEDGAISGYEKAAQYGDLKAQFKLALLYASRERDPESREKAVKWMKKAALAAYAPAQRVLGQWLLIGVMMKKNIPEAVKWISMAAKREDDTAMYILGRMYADGTGVKKDVDEALRWFRLARANGFPVPPEYFIREKIESTESISGEEQTPPPFGTGDVPKAPKAGKDLVRKVQAGLYLLGYDPGKIDGVYGAKTQKAVEDFQKSQGIQADGQITETLLENVEYELRGSKTKPGVMAKKEGPSRVKKRTVYQEAKNLYAEKKYDEVIMLLSKSVEVRNDYESNILLARAQLKKCAILKEKGDRQYKTLVQEPYEIGLKYYRSNPTLHEPYYITAVSLLINNRPSRAVSAINRAINLSPLNAEYYLVRGDAYHALLRRERDTNILKDFYLKGRMSYERALEISADNDDFIMKVQERVESIEATMESKRGDVSF